MWLVVIVCTFLLVAAVFLLPMLPGAMRRLYRPLVGMLAGSDPRTRVEQSSPRTIMLCLDTDDGETFFRLKQTPVHLVVQWTNKSPATGTHARRWTFFKFKSQRAMKDRIYDDLLIAHRSMMRS